MPDACNPFKSLFTIGLQGIFVQWKYVVINQAFQFSLHAISMYILSQDIFIHQNKVHGCFPFDYDFAPKLPASQNCEIFLWNWPFSVNASGSAKITNLLFLIICRRLKLWVSLPCYITDYTTFYQRSIGKITMKRHRGTLLNCTHCLFSIILYVQCRWVYLE